MRRATCHRLAMVFLFLLVAVACGDESTRRVTGGGGEGGDAGSGGSAGEGGSGGEPGLRCVVDPEQIAEKRDCVMDDHCPCGSHCELGQCTATCLSDADCASGESCDLFGRCRTLDGDGVPVPLAPVPGDFTLEPPAVRLQDSTTEAVLRVRVTTNVEAFRVVAVGAEVACAAGAFDTECHLDGLAAGEELELRVRGGANWSPPARLQVFGGAKLRESTLTDRPLPVAEGSIAAMRAGVRAATAVLTPGVYSGVAILRFPGVSELRAPGVEVAAKVYGGTEPRLVLADPLGLLHPSGSWVGEISGTGIQFPAARWLSGADAPVAGGSVEVLAMPGPATVEPLGEGATLGIPVSFEGITAGAAPAARWEIELHRQGDLEAGDNAPAAQAAEVLSSPSDQRARTPNAWEQAFTTTMWNTRERAYETGPLAQQPAGARAPFVPHPEACTYEGHQQAWRRIRDEILTQATPRTGIVGLPYLFEQMGILSYGYSSGDLTLTANLGGSMGNPMENGGIENQVYFNNFAWIPCGVDQPGNSMSHSYDQPWTQTGNCPSSFSLEEKSMDRCAEVSQALGCTVVDLPDPRSIFFTSNWSGRVQFVPWYNQLPTCTGTVYGSVLTWVTRACVLTPQQEPPRPSWCGESALCDEPLAGSGPTGSFIDPVSSVASNGDLACGTGRSVAFPADLSDDRMRGLRTTCRQALDRLAAAPPANPGSIASLFTEDDCFDAGRFALALGQSGELARNAALGSGADVPRSGAVAHRLLQQWVALHAFLAREASEVAGVEEALRQGAAGDTDLPSLEQSLAESMRGWGLLLDPRVGTILSGLSGELLFDPDYRKWVNSGAATQPHHVQPLGLPVTMLEALQLQLDLASAMLEKQHRASIDLAEDGIAVGLVRRAAMILALAQQLDQRAIAWGETASVGEPSWQARYELAWNGVHGSLRRVVARMRSMAAHENAIGIEDTDLPLYFLDAETPSSRFSAITDFLLGADAASTHWAPRMVSDAEDALDTLRTSWVARRDRELTRQRDEFEVSSIRADIGEEIMQLCGTPDGYVIPGRGSAEVLDNVVFFNENAPGFDPSVCASHPSAPGCTLDPTTCFRTHASGCGTGNRYPIEDARCVRGTIGEAALTVAALSKEIEVARSELADLNRAYSIASQSCQILTEENSVLNAMRSAHDATMERLTNAKAAADSVAAAAAAWKDCAGQAGGAAGGVAVGFAFSGCVAAAAEGAANITSIGLQAEMDNAQREHERALAATEGVYAVRQCMNDASMNLVEINTRALRVEQASLEMQAAIEQLENLQSTARQAWIDGVGTAAAAAELVTPLADDFWVDEALTRYLGRMKLARRMAYLAARAAEYELQQSLVARGQVLASNTPVDLAAAVQTIREDVSTRMPQGGGRPDELKAVVSLRQALLQIADHEGFPETELPLGEAERFRVLLGSSRFAAWDAQGRYLGQRIPFHVSPLGTIGLGETQGISLYAEDRCAERLWSINATIHGSDLFVGDEPAFADIQVLKANSFYSRWCQAREDEPFQVASVRPSRNLFREPDGVDVLTGGNHFGVARGTDGFTRGTIQAAFNVDRERFSEDDYGNGASAELAARGLYGDYALFFPASLLSRANGSNRTNGLALDHVDDILLRLDYVSSAN